LTFSSVIGECRMQVRTVLIIEVMRTNVFDVNQNEWGGAEEPSCAAGRFGAMSQHREGAKPQAVMPDAWRWSELRRVWF